MQFTGIVDLRGPLSGRSAAALEKLGDGSGIALQVAVGARAAVAWHDPQLLPGNSALVEGRTVVFVAGYPLLRESSSLADRPAELPQVARALLRGERELLSNACGTFCAAAVALDDGSVELTCDTLGVRPICYALREGVLYFSNSLSALATILPAPVADDLGIAQVATMGFTAGVRTTVAGVRWLLGGQWLCCSDGKLDISPQRLPVPSKIVHDEDAWLDDIAAALRRSVRRRLVHHKQAAAYLSGGLDSRVVAALLVEAGIPVHTIDFGPEGSLDAALAEQAAEAIQSRHFVYREGPLTFWDRLSQAAIAWRTAFAPNQSWQHVLMSGHGGETVLSGPSRLDVKVTAAARAGGDVAGMQALAQAERWEPPGACASALLRMLSSQVMSEASAELRAIPLADPARRLQFFELQYELRGELASFFEAVASHRTELTLPFLDKELVRASISGPLDAMLQHALYHRLIQRLPPAVTAVPWQTYPGHEPCWLPLPVARDQWAEGWLSRRDSRTQTRATGAAALRAVFTRRALRRWVRPSFVAVAAVLAAMGSARYLHVSALPLRLLNALPRL
jgi:asparagine synthetase B (glutamine-hydrolysing)